MDAEVSVQGRIYSVLNGNNPNGGQANYGVKGLGAVTHWQSYLKAGIYRHPLLIKTVNCKYKRIHPTP